jgi:hypothetical protein
MRLPLSSLLSFALVAFTLEADNEAEHRLPHRTARHGATATPGAWLTSMAMWFNCLRWVPEQGIAAREVERLARTRTNWDGMRRWGHVWFEPSPTDNRAKPPQAALIVRATASGKLAQEVWRALIPEIEVRWHERFGAAAIRDLRGALIGLASQFDRELPDCMPILKHGLVSEGPKPGKSTAATEDLDGLPLPALLARVLLALALEFEVESAVSLAIYANVLRLIHDQGTAVRNLPGLSGVSKEAIATALSYLTKRGYAVVQPELPGGKLKVVHLKPAGVLAQGAYGQITTGIERRWLERYDESAVERLRASLEAVTGDGTAQRSPLFAGIKPYPDGWRAKVPEPETLPHYPMVLHRGGYPDGS